MEVNGKEKSIKNIIKYFQIAKKIRWVDTDL